MADIYRTATLRTLYLRAGGNAHPDQATVMRELFGADQAHLVARWQRWLEVSRYVPNRF